ncbi:uncharacterized protein LOC115628422 [Scaptodrosophila lebanonensis]|uniref:Uncharacterized protein LOC115628422 n=1 Tax=Drosophila lebanonensis TaxID=7225 RepID=A0A6J2TXR4_DROLE|nr:uncharacterized protein LOC115628422 [Scaptodrosophila lebanonensis]
MFRLPTQDQCVVWLHRILLLIFTVWHHCSMSMSRSRSEALKWIRKRFSRSRRQPPGADTNTESAKSTAKTTTTTTTTGPLAVEARAREAAVGLEAGIESAELAAAGHLSEVLVLNDTQIDGAGAAERASALAPPGAVAGDMHGGANEANKMGRCTAPIARNEDEDEPQPSQKRSPRRCSAASRVYARISRNARNV